MKIRFALATDASEEEAFKIAKNAVLNKAFGLTANVYSEKLDSILNQHVCGECPEGFQGCQKTWSIVDLGTAPMLEPKTAAEACTMIEVCTAKCTLKVTFTKATVKATCGGCTRVPPEPTMEREEKETEWTAK